MRFVCVAVFSFNVLRWGVASHPLVPPVLQTDTVALDQGIPLCLCVVDVNRDGLTDVLYGVGSQTQVFNSMGAYL